MKSYQNNISATDKLTLKEIPPTELINLLSTNPDQVKNAVKTPTDLNIILIHHPSFNYDKFISSINLMELIKNGDDLKNACINVIERRIQLLFLKFTDNFLKDLMGDSSGIRIILKYLQLARLVRITNTLSFDEIICTVLTLKDNNSSLSSVISAICDEDRIRIQFIIEAFSGKIKILINSIWESKEFLKSAPSNYLEIRFILLGPDIFKMILKDLSDLNYVLQMLPICNRFSFLNFLGNEIIDGLGYKECLFHKLLEMLPVENWKDILKNNKKKVDVGYINQFTANITLFQRSKKIKGLVATESTFCDSNNNNIANLDYSINSYLDYSNNYQSINAYNSDGLKIFNDFSLINNNIFENINNIFNKNHDNKNDSPSNTDSTTYFLK